MDADAEQFMINIHYLSTSINMSMIGIGRSLNEELGLSSLENNSIPAIKLLMALIERHPENLLKDEPIFNKRAYHMMVRDLEYINDILGDNSLKEKNPKSTEILYAAKDAMSKIISYLSN